MNTSNLIGKVVAPAMLGLVGFMIWMVASKSIQDIRYAQRGSPPIEQLEQVEGAVVRWVDCTRTSKFSSSERVRLRGASGTTDVSIPCVLPVGALSDGKPHRMKILIRSDQRLVYDVSLDDKTLLAYATVKQAVDDAGSQIKFAAFVLTTLVIVFVGLLWAAVTAWRSSELRVVDS